MTQRKNFALTPVLRAVSVGVAVWVTPDALGRYAISVPRCGTVFLALWVVGALVWQTWAGSLRGSPTESQQIARPRRRPA